MKKFYTIYKITNLVNQKYYVGKHATDDIDDSYLGSGDLITKAVQKHGKDNFKKEILFSLSNTSQMNQKEEEVVTEDLVQDPMCYNIALGGQGGNLGSTVNAKISKNTSLATKGKSKSTAHKKSLSMVKTGIKQSLEVVEKKTRTLVEKLEKMSTIEKKIKYGRTGSQNGFFKKSHRQESLDQMRATIGDSRKGSKHPCAKPVTIYGVTYNSRVECMQDLGITKYQFYKILGEV